MTTMTDNQREKALLVCMPLGNCPCGVEHLRMECALCGGAVGVNPATFEGNDKVFSDYMAVCGGCAIDLIDADPQEREFRLTDSQLKDPRTNLIKAMHGEKWPERTMALLR